MQNPNSMSLYLFSPIFLFLYPSPFLTPPPLSLSLSLSHSQAVCVTSSKFQAHLVNQMIVHEIVALELLTLLLEEPTDDIVEVAVSFLKVKYSL